MSNKDEVDGNLKFIQDSAKVPISLFHEAQREGLIRKDIDLPEKWMRGWAQHSLFATK